ncbi:MAG: PKD domain-containing protein [Colwellia sp.]
MKNKSNMSLFKRFNAWLIIVLAFLSFSCSDDEKPDIEEIDLLVSLSTVTKENTLSIKTGSTSKLDASPAHCLSNGKVTYSWSLDAKPSGSTSVLENSDSAIASIQTDVDGDYNASVDISCGPQVVSVVYTITSTPVTENAKPQAQAAVNTHTSTPDALTPDVIPPDQKAPASSPKLAVINTAPHAAIQSVHSAKVGEVIHLSGHLSTDADGDSLTYTWTLETLPTGSTASIQDADMADALLSADTAGTYKISLSVNDGETDSTVSELTLSVEEIPLPIANAGADASEQLGQQVTLHGAGSHDLNNAVLTYSWHLNHQPTSSTLTFNESTDEAPQFTPDVEGVYVFKLIVNNGTADSAPDTVSINIIPIPTQTVQVDLYQSLLDLGLDSTDAHNLVDNHKAEAEAVIANTNRLFKGVTLTNDMFKGPNATGANTFRSNNLSPGGWESRHITRFKKAFGRINFVVNSSKFKAAFDAQVALLNTAYQGTIPGSFENIAFPASYDQYIADSNAAIADSHNIFQFFLSDNTTGTAWGAHDVYDADGHKLKLLVERAGMMGDAAGSTKPWDINQATALSFHELMHSLGYQHDGTSNETTLKPNNIPYFVQIIAGYRSEDILATYCKGSITPCAPPDIRYGTPNALLTQYFGNK